MQIEMLNGYVVDIKVKKTDQKRCNKKETAHMLNRMSICFDMAGRYCENNKDTYFERISKGIAIAIDKTLYDIGYFDNNKGINDEWR